MSSSRFVASTLNGMCIAQLAAWMTVPGGATAHNAEPALRPQPALLSRADDDPARTLDDEWHVVIPVSGEQPETRVAANRRLMSNNRQTGASVTQA